MYRIDCHLFANEGGLEPARDATAYDPFGLHFSFPIWPMSSRKGRTPGSGIGPGVARQNIAPRWFKITLTILLVFCWTLCPIQLRAATLTWTGLAGDGNIATAGNWSSAQAPVSGDTLIFAGTTSLAPQLATSQTVATITFNSTASAFTLGGAGTYTIKSGITNSSVNTETINNAIILGGNQTWNASSGNLVFNGNINNGGFLLTINGAFADTINGIISGSGGLTKSGTGTLSLLGANTFSGAVKLSAGTTVLGSNTAVGSGALSLGTATLKTNGTAVTLSNVMTFTGNTTFANADALIFSGLEKTGGSNRTLTLNGAGSVTFDGVFSGNRLVTKAGSGTLVLNGANTLSNGVTLSAGTLIVGNDSAAGTDILTLNGGTIQGATIARTLANAVTLGGNTTFGGTDLTFTGATTAAAVRTLTVNNNTTFSGVVSGAGGLTKGGSGTLMLSGASDNTFTGAVAVNDGTLVFNKTATKNAMKGTVLTIGDNIGASGSAILRYDASNQLPTVAVTVNTDGLFNLQGFTDAIGTLTMTGGSVVGTSISRLDLGGNVTVSATGTNVAQITAGVGLVANRTFTINDNAVSTDIDLSISGIISTGFALTKAGAGTLLLSGTNTYSGGTTANNGTLYLDNNSALGTAAVNLGDTTGNNSATLLFSSTAGRTVTNAITAVAGSSGTLTLGGVNTSGINSFGGNITLAKSLTLTAAAGGEVDLNGIISGATFGVTKIGAGTVRFAGANTYTGLSTISAGTLLYGSSNEIATGGVTIDGATAVLDLGVSHTDTVGQVILDNGGTITGSGTSALSSTAAFDVRNGSVTIPLSGSVALTKSTSATVTLSGVNTYTGITTVSAGTLLLGVVNSLPSTSAVTISSGAVLDLGSFNQSIGSLASAGTVALGTATLTTGGDNTATTFSGVISGTGGLTKNGSGIFTISGTNTFAGATTINTGTLKLGATGGIPATSAVTVASGAIFDLNSLSATIGSLAGAGSVTPGSGTLTTGGNNSTTAFSGVINGTGGLTKTGSGTFTLSGTNTFSGSFIITNGALTLSGTSGRTASASGVTIGTGATLTLDNSAGQNTDRIGNSAAITLNGGTLRFISASNGSTETVGALNASGGASSIAITHNGAVTDSTSLTFSSLGTIATGATVNFSASGGTLGANSTGPHIYITGKANGLLGGWATVGSDFAEYFTDGVRAYSSYYTGSLGININDATKIPQLSSSSPSGAYTLTNVGTTTDLGLSLNDIAIVDLGALSTRTLNLSGGGLVKGTATATTISGTGRLTVGGTATGTLSVSVDAGHTLTVSASVIDNAGTNGIYGDAGDGVVSLSKGDAGVLVLSGTNTYTGNNFINTGTVQISAENNLGALANDVTFGGGTLSITAGFTASTGKVFTISSDLTGTLDIASAQTLTLGNLSDVLTTGNTAGLLRKTNAGALVIQAANPSFDGTMQIDAGSVELRNAQSLGDSVNRGRITLNSGTLKLRNDTNTTFANDVTVTADSIIDVARLTGTTPAVTHTLGALSIGANTLTITGSNGAALTFGAVTLTGAATFNPTTADTTLGAVSGSFGITKIGAGALVLTGAGSYTGTTTINAGTLRLGVAGGVASTSAVSVASGAVFDLNNLSATIGSLTGAGSVTLGSGILTSGGDNTATTFSGIIGGSGGLTKTGTGIFTLSGANTYTGATTINGGTLTLGVAGGIPSSSALTVNVASSATFDLNNFNSTIGSLTGAGSVTLGSGTLTAGGDNSSTSFTGIVSGSGGLTKSGSGVFTLSGANTFTGTTNINSGVVVGQNTTALGSTAGGTVVASGGELRIAAGSSVGAEALTLSGSGTTSAGALRVISGTASWSGNVTLASAATIGVDAGQLTLGGTINLGSNTLTFASTGATQSDGIISGSGGLVKNGAGTLTLTAANIFSGATMINLGVLNVQNGAAFGTPSTGAVTLASGAAIQLNNAGGINVGDKSITLNGDGISSAGAIDSVVGHHSWAGNMTLASDVTVAVEADSLTISGAIGQSGGVRAFTKIGAGTLLFGGNNSYTGATRINAGTLQLASSERIADTSAVTIAAGATFSVNDFDETIGSLAGAGAVNFGTLATASLTSGGDNTSTAFSGVLSGTGDFIKTGTGTQTLSGANTSIGIVFINAGVLSISADTNLGDPTSTLDFGGGTLQLTSAMTIARAINLSTTGTIDTSGVNSTISSVIGGIGTLTKISAGTLSLTGVNTYTGDTLVSGGTLSVGATGVIASANVSVSSGATLSIVSGGAISTSTVLTADGAVSFNSATATIGTLNGASTGVTTLNSTNLTVNDGTFAGVLQNGASAGALTKTSTGILTLTGANTFTGATSVNLGTLALGSGGSLGGTIVTVGSGTTPTASSGNAILQINGNYTIGTTTLGGLTIMGGNTGGTPLGQGTLSLQSGAINTLTLANNSATINLTLGGTAGNPSILNFDLGNSTTDLIAVGKKLTLNAGGAVIYLNQLAGTNIATGTYNLLTFTAPGSAPAGAFTLGAGSTAFGGHAFSLTTYTISSTFEQLIVTSNVIPTTAYWTGSQDTFWNSFGVSLVTTNFSTDATGATNTAQLPGSVTDVIFTANSVANLTTTLGQDFSIKSLTFTGTGTIAASSSVTIGGANTLTLGTGGITVQSGSTAHSISTNVALGAAQSWTNNSGSLLTVSGNVSNSTNLLTIAGSGSTTVSGVIGPGSGGLTKSGAGTLTLSGTNTYSGGTNVVGGTLQAGASGGGQTGTGVTTVGDGTNAATLAGTGTISGTVNATNHIIRGVASLKPGDSGGNLNGALTFNGNLNLNNNSQTILQITTRTATAGTFGGNPVGSAAYIAYLAANVATWNSATPGNHDSITVNGTLTLGTNAAGLIQVLDNGYVSQALLGDVYDLLDWNSIVVGSFNSGTTIRSGGAGGGDLFLPDLSARGLGWDVRHFTSSGVLVVVPEPSRAVMISAGLAALLLRRKRR